MANIENLTMMGQTLTTERAQEIGSKGGKASAKARKERKAIKEQLEMLLGLPLKDKNAKAKLKKIGINADEINNQMAMVISIYQKALKGDVSAFKEIRDTVGEKPTENLNLSGNVNNVYANLSEEELRNLANGK